MKQSQSMGVGTVYLMLAQAFTLLASYIINIGVAYFLGQEMYGMFGVLTSLYLINRAFLDTGVVRTVSKFLAEFKGNVASLLYFYQKVQLISSICFALFYVVFAYGIAWLLKDLTLTPYIMYLGIIIIPLSLLSLYTQGFMNGLSLFKEQAIVKIVFPTLKIILTFIFMFLGFKLWGIWTGYLISILGGIYLCFFFLRKNRVNIKKGEEKTFSVKKLLVFSAPISIASLMFGLIRNVNILFIKSFLIDNKLVALFTAAATIANIPFMIFWALPFALLPKISKSIAAGRENLTKKYISQSVRYLLLLILPISALVAATSREVLGLLYPSVYQSAAPLLSVLVITSSFLALFITLNTIMIGSGKQIVQLFFVGSSLLFLIILNVIFLSVFKLGLIWVAFSSLASSVLVVFLSGMYIYRKFKTIIRLSSLIRISLGSLIIFIIAAYWHYSGILLVVNYLCLFLVYFLLLYLFGEISANDWKLIAKLLKLKSLKYRGV